MDLKKYREFLDTNKEIDEIEISYKLKRKNDDLSSDDNPDSSSDDNPDSSSDDNPDPSDDDKDKGDDEMSDEKYTPYEFAEAAEKFWPDKNTRPSRYVIIAAFNISGKTEATPEEGIELINNFMYEKVK